MKRPLLDHLFELTRAGAVRLNAYKCPQCGGGWHVGHLPKPRT